MLENYLVNVTDSVEVACGENLGTGLESMTYALVNAFFKAKFLHPEASKALYSIASDIEAHEIVTRLMQRSQASISALLASANDAEFEDPISATFVITTTMIGPVQALLAMNAPVEYQQKIRRHLGRMAYAYLREISSKHKEDKQPT